MGKALAKGDQILARIFFDGCGLFLAQAGNRDLKKRQLACEPSLDRDDGFITRPLENECAGLKEAKMTAPGRNITLVANQK